MKEAIILATLSLFITVFNAVSLVILSDKFVKIIKDLQKEIDRKR